MEGKKTNPWQWIPSLYFVQGLPYVVVMAVSVVMYKSLGISNAALAFYTSWLYLPWVIKPIWSPLVEIIGTKRKWVVMSQLFLGASLACVAFTLQTDLFFQYSLAFFWLVAFSSATHDIASDGFYLAGLPEGQQSFFVGIRSTFYRLSMIVGQGALVVLAGYLEVLWADPQLAWSAAIGVVSLVYFVFFIYHKMVLPRPIEDEERTTTSIAEIASSFFVTFKSFFQKDHIGVSVLFLMTYRLGESQLVKLASPFMLDTREVGGLGLTTTEVGVVYGTFGVISLVVGGILGGILISRRGLRYWIWWMLAAINLPNLVYVYLSLVQPDSFALVTAMVVIEQFGYGFGFAGYLMYMIYLAQGQFSTAHYAIATGFMALGMMIPGMVSGWVQEWLGYQYFFVWVVIATIPSFVITAYLKIDNSFGLK